MVFSKASALFFFVSNLIISNLVRVSHMAKPTVHVNVILLHVLYACVCVEAGEPGILITHGFLNRWYFTGSISRPWIRFHWPDRSLVWEECWWVLRWEELPHQRQSRGGDGGEEWKGGGQYLSLHLRQSVSESPTLSDWTSLFSVNELPCICS